MAKQKLARIARKKEKSIIQLLLIAVYKTASDQFPETTMLEKKEKFNKLKSLFRLCEKKGLSEDDVDTVRAKTLKKQISKKLDIEVENITNEALALLNDSVEHKTEEDQKPVFDSSDSDDEVDSQGRTVFTK